MVCTKVEQKKEMKREKDGKRKGGERRKTTRLWDLQSTAVLLMSH